MVSTSQTCPETYIINRSPGHCLAHKENSTNVSVYNYYRSANLSLKFSIQKLLKIKETFTKQLVAKPDLRLFIVSIKSHPSLHKYECCLRDAAATLRG